MADNPTLPATGVIVSGDDVGGGVVLQRVKLDIGGAGASIRVTGGAARNTAQSIPVAIASDQSPIATNPRLLTPSDTVTIAGGNVVAQAFLYDGFGNQLRGVSPTGGVFQLQVNTSDGINLFNWTATVITVGTTTYTTIVSRNYKEFLILANITAITGSITFVYQIQDGNGNWVTAWSSAAISATGVQAISVGPGTANPTSLGLTGRLQAVVTGTSATVTGSVQFRT